MSPRVGIGLPNQVRDVDPRLVVEWSTRAEAAGFAALGSIGRVAYPGVMDTVALAAAAGVTRSIELLSAVVIGPAWPAVLLAKEVAGIDGVSGGRLTLGVGVGLRPDDFTVPGHGPRDRGARFDADLATYRSVWSGEPVGGTNPAVPSGTRQVPMLFGGTAPAAFTRMARHGVGYIAPSSPTQAAGEFAKAREAWKEQGRDGEPRLVALAYFAFGDVDAGRRDVADYYANFGPEIAGFLAAQVLPDPAAVREAVTACADLGVDTLLLNPTIASLDQLSRLADAVI